MVIAAGHALSQRYRIQRPLQQGPQPRLWVADHLALNAQVAVKVLDRHLALSEEGRERFRKEVSAAARLKSPHVIQILDHGIEENQPYIVMELLEGEDLAERIRKRRRLAFDDTIEIVTHVTRALTRAHAAELVHRGLKPGNVFLVANEDAELVKVLDFGVASMGDPRPGTRIGIVRPAVAQYMSPEQLHGETADVRSDVWAVGVLAYQCATGKLPFIAATVDELRKKVMSTEPALPSKVVAGLPVAFDAWFLRACARAPEARFQSAREMAEELAKTSPDADAHRRPSSVMPPARQGSMPHIHATLQAGSMAGFRASTPASTPTDELDEGWGESEAEDAAATPRPPAPPKPAARAASAPPLPPTRKDPEPVAEELSEQDVVEAAPAPPAPAPPPPDAEPEAAASPSPAVPEPQAPPAEPSRPAPPPQPTPSASPSSGEPISVFVPDELDGSNRRRRVVGLAVTGFLGLTGLVVWAVASPYLRQPAPPQHASPEVTTAAPAPSPSPSPPPTASEPSQAAVDPGKVKEPEAERDGGAKKPAVKPASTKPAAPQTGAPRPARPRPDGEPEITIPEPDPE